MHRRFRDAATIVLLAGLYAAAAKLALSIDVDRAHIAIIWPPMGLALAAVLLCGPRVWPGITIGAFVAARVAGLPLLAAVAVAAGSTLASLMAAHALTRRTEPAFSLERLQGAVSLIVVVPLSAAVSATLGALGLAATGAVPWSSFPIAWAAWWGGDAMGMLVVTPALIAWARAPSSAPGGRSWGEFAALVAALLAVAVLAVRLNIVRPAVAFPLAYMVFPFALWAALRLGVRGAATVIVLVTATAMWETSHGFGPIAGAAVVRSVALLAVFVAVVAIPSLILAAVIEERALAAGELRESEARFRGAFDHAAIGMAITAASGRWLKVNRALCDSLGYTEQELLGTSFASVTHPDDVNANDDLLRRAVAGEIDAYDMEKRFIHKQGHVVWVALNASVVRASDGQLLYLVGHMQDITARRQAESRLRESEARYERHAANVPGVVYQFVYRPDGRKAFLFASEGARTLFGLAPEAFLQDHTVVLGLIHPEDRTGFHVSGSAAVAALEPWHWEGRIVRPTGEERWVQVAARNVGQPDGSILCDGLVMDVTDLWRTRTALRRREQELVALTENSPDVIARFDRAYRHVYVNAAVEKATGIPSAAWSGRTHEELGLPDAFAARWREVLARVFETGQPSEMRFEFATPDGPRWYDSRLVPELGADAVETVMAIGRDVTEQRQAEEARREREAHFRSLSASSPVGIFQCDNAGNVAYTNPRLLQIWGATHAELLDHGWLARVHPDDARSLFARWTVALEAGEQYEHEFRLLLPDGAVRWVRGRSAPLRNAVGEQVGAVGTIEDITERRALEEQLRQAQKIEAVGQLAGGIAHDFNNIVTAIKLHTELLLEELAPGDGRREDAEEVRKGAIRAAGLTRQLLAFSRQQLMAPVVLDLNDAVAELRKMVGRLLGADIEIVTTLAPDAGQVLADCGQMEQVLVNLAVNARDAMPAGGRLTIRTANVALDGLFSDEHPITAAGEYVMLCVSDTGCGMSPDVQARIFEPFYSTKAPGRGSGLGLAMVHGIVKQSGGEIRVRSEPGRGSSFTIYLPRVRGTGADAGAGTRPTPLSAPALTATREVVLLVEDEDAVRTVARRILVRHGYVVLEACNGREALSIAERREGAIDLVVTDAVMPELGGAEVIRALRASRPGIGVLLMSGYTDDEMLRRGILDAETSFLAKPFTAGGLLRRVREVLDESRCAVTNAV